MSARCLMVLLFAVSAPSVQAGVGSDPRAALRQAVALIQAGEHSFARTVLAPALIHPLLSSAERARGYYLRGFSYLRGGHVVSARKDFNRALEFDEDHVPVLVALGDLHARGAGTVRNRRLAYTLFAKAAALGSAEGQLFAGRALLLGEGTNYDAAAARELLRAPAEAGDARAMRLLGMSFRAPYAEPPEPERALAWYERAEAAGDAQAAVAIAHMQRKGELGTVDAKAACERFQRAAEAGAAAAHASLAHCYLAGGGFAEDAAAARHHFERAAAGGHVDGYLGLGYLYEQGVGVASSAERAGGWYERAAAAGSARGQYDFGRWLLAQPERQDEALEWLRLAAESGEAAYANAYAWVLATHRSEERRDGARALQFAQYAVHQRISASFLDTLAAAYAELGRFEEAVAAQRRALEASALESPDLKDRLQRYEAGQPWRE